MCSGFEGTSFQNVGALSAGPPYKFVCQARFASARLALNHNGLHLLVAGQRINFDQSSKFPSPPYQWTFKEHRGGRESNPIRRFRAARGHGCTNTLGKGSDFGRWGDVEFSLQNITIP